MNVVILCGGLGTRLREETEYRPKPMVPIGDRPILWHIMARYAAYGFKDFILCLGYKGYMIKDYFLQYRTRTSNFTLSLGRDPAEIRYHGPHEAQDWRITFVETGETAMTGARVKRSEPFVDGDTFLLTYGDGVADIDLAALVRFHQRHGRIGTVTSVRPTARFGELLVHGSQVAQFVEKPAHQDGAINGGFFVLQREFFRYVTDDDGCVLEQEPLQRLAREGQLMAFAHRGYWQCMDTYRDLQHLNERWQQGQAPWSLMLPAAAPKPRRAAKAVAR